MTSGLQPNSSGAPVPVPGVTGGPPVLGGQISNDPNDGSVVVAPNPGNVLQIRKGSQPTAFQIYEYFHTNTDFARLALNSQTGGPFQLSVETAPPSVIRGLQINAGGSLFINTDNVHINTSLEVSTNLVVDGVAQFSSQGIVLLQNVGGANFALTAYTAPPAPTTTETLDWIVTIGAQNYRIRLYQ